MREKENDDVIKWSSDMMVEVTLPNPDNFLKVRETLTRIGVASRQEKKLYQSCHILHKQGRYFIVHFKELFALDGKSASISNEDLSRRDTIACLLEDWGLIKLIKKLEVNKKESISQIKIVPFKEKHEWELVPKYTIGRKR
jgi:hypothetical protein